MTWFGCSWWRLGFRQCSGISGNILAVTGEEKFNLKINIIFVVVHAVIDITAVKLLGIYGAAIALIVVYFVIRAYNEHSFKKYM